MQTKKTQYQSSLKFNLSYTQLKKLIENGLASFDEISLFCYLTKQQNFIN